MEQELEIKTNIGKNGTEYKNINLKDKSKTNEKGIQDGNYIIVEKTSVDGFEHVSPTLKTAKGDPVISFSCKARYKGQDVSFWLSAREHELYKAVGGVGDKVKISLAEEKKVNPRTGVKNLIPVLSFSLAN